MGNKKIVVIGAVRTRLAAAHRLEEFGCDDRGMVRSDRVVLTGVEAVNKILWGEKKLVFPSS
jgi:hypothetical protein